MMKVAISKMTILAIGALSVFSHSFWNRFTAA
jgi:hypothetical protein